MLNFPSQINGIQVTTTGDTRAGVVIPPMPMSPYSMLTIPAYKRAMDLKSSTMATFPREVHKGGVKLEVPHPLDGLLQRRPNGYQTGTKFWTTLFFHHAHYNNGYARIERDPRTSKPIALHNLLPETVEPVRLDMCDGNGLQQFYAIFSGKSVYLPGDDVIHISGMSYDGMVGMTSVVLMGTTLQRAAMLDRFQTRYLQHGTIIRGALQFTKTLPKEKIDQLENMLIEKYSSEFGTAKSDVMILTDGGTLNNTTISPQDGQLVQQQALSTKQIGQMTNVPPQFLYENTEAKYVNSVEQVGRDVISYTFLPIIDQVDDELTQKLLTPADQVAGYTIELDPSSLQNGDAKAQADKVNALAAAGIITANEARKMIGLTHSDDPEADKLKVRGDNAVKIPAAEQTKTSE